MPIFTLFTLGVTACVYVCSVDGHGMMISPPGRSTAWRYDTTGEYFCVNYDDNGLYCGQRAVQFEINSGRCGICGDDYRLTRPRYHERGGYFSTGNIVAQYRIGDVISVKILITVNHKGRFYFDLFPSNDPDQTEEESLFIPLYLDTGAESYELPSENPGVYTVQLKVPQVTCTNCVLRWIYKTGNHWGCDGTTCCVGCGVEQEYFYACADVMITVSGSETIPPWVKINPNTATTRETTITTTTSAPVPTTTTTTSTPLPTTTTTTQTTTSTPVPTTTTTTTTTMPTTTTPEATTTTTTPEPIPTTKTSTTRQTTLPVLLTPKPSVVCLVYCSYACNINYKQFCSRKLCGHCPSFKE